EQVPGERRHVGGAGAQRRQREGAGRRVERGRQGRRTAACGAAARDQGAATAPLPQGRGERGAELRGEEVEVGQVQRATRRPLERARARRAAPEQLRAEQR